jgi:hypothetical protein
MAIEGYYDSGISAMRSVKNNQDFVSPTTDVEDLVIELRDSVTLELVATTIATLHTDGTLQATFSTGPSGSYYIAVKGSNLVQTWTGAPVSVGSTPLDYNFTTAAEQAYGSNMVEVSAGVWAIFSGDINQDGNIDNSDYGIWEADSNDFAFGVYATDLNGDGNVDNSDYAIWEANSNNFVFSYIPML